MNSRILYGILLILIGSCATAKAPTRTPRKYIFPKRHPEVKVVEAPKPEPAPVEEAKPEPVVLRAVGRWVIAKRPVYGRFGRFQGYQSVYQWQGPSQRAYNACANGSCK